MADRICAIPGCGKVIPSRRSRYCSVECAHEAMLKQARAAAERTRQNRKSSTKKPRVYGVMKDKPPPRPALERRAVRAMQSVPVERWGEYEFEK